jgi:hypothetical protein
MSDEMLGGYADASSAPETAYLLGIAIVCIDMPSTDKLVAADFAVVDRSTVTRAV